jgi:hypothetical protein
MATEVIDKDFITIKVSKKIGATGIKRVKDFVKSLESANGKPKKVNQKLINELSREINKAAWEKLKRKRGFNF